MGGAASVEAVGIRRGRCALGGEPHREINHGHGITYIPATVIGFESSALGEPLIRARYDRAQVTGYGNAVWEVAWHASRLIALNPSWLPAPSDPGVTAWRRGQRERRHPVQ